MNKSNNHYNKPPIIEAVIDIVIQLSEKNSQLSELSKLKSLLNKKFLASIEEISEDTIQFKHLKATTEVGTSREKIGYKFTSMDKKQILQVRKDHFTFSNVGLYDSWEKFRAETRALWDIFCKKYKPIKVYRVAVRYINRIDIPELKPNLEDYFQTYPKVLGGTNGEINNFFLQVQIPQHEGGMAILNQRVTTPPIPGYTSIIFDIDVFDLKQFDPSNAELWERIETLRIQKNNLFENSITEKTKRLF